MPWKPSTPACADLRPRSGTKTRGAPVAAPPPRPLRICLLGYRSDPHSGGQGVYLRYLSKALAALGHDVRVVSGEPYPELHDGVRLVRLPGLNLYRTGHPPRGFRVRYLRSFTDLFEWQSVVTGGFPEPYTFGRRAARYVLAHRHEIDVVHDNQSLAYGLLRLQHAGIPVLSTVHHPITRDRALALENAGTWLERSGARRWYAFIRMQKRVARRLAGLLAVSESSRQDTARAFGLDPGKIAVVRNGIDTDRFRPPPSRLHVRRASRLIATASADTPLKGLEHLLRALAILRSRHPALVLTIIGRVHQTGPNARLIASLALGEHVRILSALTTEEIVAEYARSDIAVVPSLYEGFGLPAGEAMACAVPVVATSGGALPEVVGDTGVVVPPATPEALAAAIEALIDDPDRRAAMGQAGRHRVLGHFQWSRAASELEPLYRARVAEVGSTPEWELDGNRRLQTNRA